MKKKLILCMAIFLILIVSIIIIFNVEIKKDKEIIYFSLSDTLGRFDEITCYDDGISYDKKLDVSIVKVDIKKILFFYKITLEYKDGNLCDREFLLEENYINDFIENAIIKDNPYNIDIDKLIKDKEAKVSNTRYFGNDYETYISYILNDRHEILYVFYNENLLIIQVGLSDEGPKFIAYK